MISGKVITNQKLQGKVSEKSQTLSGVVKEGVGGISYYKELPDKPQINGVELIGNKTLDELNIQAKDVYATQTQAGVIKVGDNLDINDGVISVQTTNNAEEDNTKPMTSAGVYTQLGNINVLLSKI